MTGVYALQPFTCRAADSVAVAVSDQNKHATVDWRRLCDSIQSRESVVDETEKFIQQSFEEMTRTFLVTMPFETVLETKISDAIFNDRHAIHIR